MRGFPIVLLVLAGCGSSGAPAAERPKALRMEDVPSGPSAAPDAAALEAWSGKKISVVGTFEHLHFKHGVLRLASGLKIYLPHFDAFMQGDDWFKYIGQRCTAYGILHTYTKDIEGYRGPSLELYDFTGP